MAIVKQKIDDLFETINPYSNILKSEHGIKVYKISNFLNNDNTFILMDNSQYKKLKEEDKVPKRDDILISRVGTIGEIFHINNNDNFYITDNFIWLRSKSNNVLSKYFYYLFLSNKNLFKKMNSGSTQPLLVKSKFLSLIFPIPSISYQQKIIDIIEPKQYLYKKYSNLIKIENYDSFIESWNILIDIIEHFEKLKESINRKLHKMNVFLLNIYKFLKIDEKIKFNKLCKVLSKKYENQKYYIDTSLIKTSIIKEPKFLENKINRSNLTVSYKSIIFSKLKGENKVYPIFKESLLQNVYSTGFINIFTKYSSYIYGFLLSNNFIILKHNNSVGTLMEGINNTIVNNWNINNLDYKKWNNKFDLSLSLINYYNDLIINIDKIINLLLNLCIN